MMRDAEAIQLIQSLMDGGANEFEVGRTLARLERITGCPDISTYIFHPGGDWYSGEAPTAREIFARARRTRATLL